MTDNGQQLAGVQVLSHHASTNSGSAGLPNPTMPASGNKWDLTQTTDRDVLAGVAFFGPYPVVLGFRFPQVCQMLFADLDRVVNRTPSDFYTTTDAAGNFEAYHPNGTYFRIGTSPAHEDLTGKNVDGSWAIKKNTGAAVHAHLQVANAGSVVATLDIDPSGNITLQNNGNLTATVGGNLQATISGTTTVNSSGAATLKAPSVTIDSPQTTCTGALTVEGAFTYQAGMVGSGGSGASAQISGSIHATGDITAGGISLDNHTHSDPQGGTVGRPQ